MVPLILVSVVMWVLIINRAIFFRRLYRKNMGRIEAGQYVKENRLPDVHLQQGAVALLVSEFLSRRSRIAEIDLYILDETVFSITSSLNRFLSAIGMLAGIAPLLGLLGTVTGMLSTFDVISQFGTGNARAMADGISEALISTQTGLLIAIPGLYMANFLKRRAERLKQRIASVGIYLKQFV
ncbi:MAG: MotA/TolQ/ExbB proton channel family protein [Proteobacteria bacterium]|nr:MotA/TolQ/ExbB proton channel family protein [Pseudomonadota bacterium]